MLFRVPPHLSLLAAQIGLIIKVFVVLFKIRVFIVNETSRVIVMFELTCPWDANIARSHEFKENKYAPLVADLSRRYKVFNFSVEVSVRGQVSKPNKERIKVFLYRACSDPKSISKSAVWVCSKVSLLSSFSVFSARNEPTWESPAPLIHY